MVSKKDSIKFIAEIGINHNGSIDLAKKHVEEAKRAGATVAKFQTYFAHTRVNKDSPIYEILKSCELNIDEFLELADFCKELDIEFASTPFCVDSFEALKKLNCSFIKIASFHLSNFELLNKVFLESNSRDVIISTGVSSFNEILKTNHFYNNIKRQNKPKLTFMHCVSEYPISSLENLNLINIREIAEETKKEVGFSDHSIGFMAPSHAVSLGARVIEKHFTIDNSLEGADHAMSSNPEIFKKMVVKCNEALKMIGQRRNDYIHFDCEKNIVPYLVKSEK